VGASSKEELRSQLANEFSHAADLYRQVAGLLEQSEPGLSQVCRALLAEPPGFQGQPDQIADEAASDKPQHVIHLMQWWASYGDFEAVLMSAAPSTGKPGFFASKDKGLSKAKLEIARAKVYGNQACRPLNWYVQLSKSTAKDSLCSAAVAEALRVYANGDWKTFDDLKVDFFDAVTRSIGLRMLLLCRHDRGLSEKDLCELADQLGLAVNSEPASESPATSGAVRPALWDFERSTRNIRPAFRVSGHLLPATCLVARPKSYLRMASKYESDQHAWKRERLIKAARHSWPSSQDFAKKILGLLSTPERAHNGVSALKALAGFLTLALETAPAKEQLKEKQSNFFTQLQECLKVSDTRILAVRPNTDRAFRRVPCRTAEQENRICYLKIDREDIAIGKLRRCEAEDDVFDAVWLYDLHLWAVDEVSQRSKHLGYTALMAALNQAGCWDNAWEEIKKSLLGLTSDASAEAIAQAFSALWPRVLAFRAVAAKEKSGAEQLFDEVDQLLKEMVHATLQLLEKRGGTTFPPRFSRVEQAGEIDLKQWLAEDGRWQDGHSVEIEVRSGAGPELVEAAAPTRLQMDLPGFDEHNPHDVRLVNMPGVFFWRGGDPPPYVRLIHQHVCEPIVAAFSGGSPAPVDFGTALKSLRQAFSSGDGAKAFDGLVKAAVEGNDNATRWLDYLKEEPRFQLDCFPRIENHEGKWIPSAPGGDDEYVQWDYDDRSPKTLIRVTYAMNSAASAAVFSKGPRDKFLELAAADAVNQWCVRVGGEATERGNDLLRATERHWAFDHPLGTTVRLAAELLDQIGEAGTIGKTVDPSEIDKLRDDGYQALKAWLAAVEGVVTPDDWSAREGSDPRAEDRDTLSWAFSSLVPTGRTIVHEFGVKAFDYEKPFAGALSAGKPFPGYEEIDDMSRTFWTGAWAELAAMWNRVPGLSDKNRRARVLYQIYQDLSLRETNESVSWYASAKDKLVSILEAEFGWEPFPDEDEVELGPSLAVDRVELEDGRKAVSGAVVKVIAKGFKQRTDRDGVTQPAIVKQK
jgi:hypothetical protein